MNERRARQTFLVNQKQELLAPASNIVELCELLIKDANDRDQAAFALDIEKIHKSAKSLLSIVHKALDPANLSADQEEFSQQVRHDLRNSVGNIIGRSEDLLEDAEELLLEGFVPDLTRILGLGKDLLSSIDRLLTFGKSATDPDINIDEVSRGVAQSMAPSCDQEKRTQPGKILVVDDNRDNRELLQRRLTGDGHRIHVAVNGRQALEMLYAESFDLVLLDLIMPELNGFEVLRVMKRDDRTCHVPVIIISGMDEMDSVVHCIEHGAEDYLPKPINRVLLKARIDSCLEKKRLLDQIKKEQQRADALLHVILPSEIVKELKETDTVLPRRFNDVAVLFCDIVGFTTYCEGNDPEQVVRSLQDLIGAWEEIAIRHQVEKIKTIGDAFMAAAGLLRKTTEHPVMHCVRCGLEMIAACQSLPVGWDLRVGIHVGPVVAGVIGKRQYLFDLWGDTVNTAARMESHGVAGAVVMSGPAWDTIKLRCSGESRGVIKVKGKGPMEMFRFDGFLQS